MTIRIGHGYDVHRFCDGDFVMLGGVRIPYDQGLEAHSDGDVVIHALCDALLGAAALGDIGKHFPDSDPTYKNIESRKLLRHVCALLLERGWHLGNADITLIAQAPKVSSYTEQICVNLAEDLNVNVSQVNLKATTTEKLGFVGRKEGIATHAVVLLRSND